MALADDIEFYGRAVATGEMNREQAVVAIVEASNGGITPIGADDLITNWQTARGSYEREYSRAFHGVAAIENGRKPHPSSQPNQQ